VLSLIVALVVALTGCSKSPDPADGKRATGDPSAPLSVFVANYPLQYFAERIGGAHVRVSFPLPADGDPAYWNPTPEDIVAFQNADMILLNGASYSRWVSRTSLPRLRTLDTSASFADRYIALDDRGTHNHGPEGAHEHGTVAFTTWLDPLQALAQARAIRDALIRQRPEQADDFNQGFDGLAADLQELDDKLAAVFASVGAHALVFSHPVYQYLIRRYGIGGRSVQWEPDAIPTSEQWEALEQLLAEQPARWMIWEGKPNPSTADELKQRGLGSLVFGTCANLPCDGDYLSVMRANAARLAEAFAP
jgi:zinc transport system substrate-binding protein